MAKSGYSMPGERTLGLPSAPWLSSTFCRPLLIRTPGLKTGSGRLAVSASARNTYTPLEGLSGQFTMSSYFAVAIYVHGQRPCPKSDAEIHDESRVVVFQTFQAG
jgi:hypothetical protein